MAECKIVPERIEIDPEERKRRLCRVYTILFDLATKQEAAEREYAGSEFSQDSERAPAVQD